MKTALVFIGGVICGSFTAVFVIALGRAANEETPPPRRSVREGG